MKAPSPSWFGDGLVLGDCPEGVVCWVEDEKLLLQPVAEMASRPAQVQGKEKLWHLPVRGQYWLPEEQGTGTL